MSSQIVGIVGSVDKVLVDKFRDTGVHVVDLKKLSLFPITEHRKHLLVVDLAKYGVQKDDIKTYKTLLREKVALLFLNHTENEPVIRSLFEGVSIASPPTTAGSTIVQLSHESGISQEYKAQGFLPLATTHIVKSDRDPIAQAALIVRQLPHVYSQLLQYPNGNLVPDSQHCIGIFYYSYTSTIIVDDSAKSVVCEVAVTYHVYKENGLADNAYTVIVQVKRGSVTPVIADSLLVHSRLGVKLQGNVTTTKLVTSAPNDRVGIVTPTFVAFKKDIKYLSDSKPAVFNAVYKNNLDIYNWGCMVTNSGPSYGGVEVDSSRYYFDFFGRNPWNLSTLESLKDLNENIQEKLNDDKKLYEIFYAHSYSQLNWEGGQVWTVETDGSGKSSLTIALNMETLTVKDAVVSALSCSTLEPITISLK